MQHQPHTGSFATGSPRPQTRSEVVAEQLTRHQTALREVGFRFEIPPTHVFRRFLYLDGDQVLNALSSLSGGSIDEVLEKTLKEGGGSLGIGFSVLGAKIQLGGKGTAKAERQIRRRQTVHSAVTTLLKELARSGQIACFETDKAIPHLAENMFVQFPAFLLPPRESRIEPSSLTWLQRTFGVDTTKLLIRQREAADHPILAFAEVADSSKDPSGNTASSSDDPLLARRRGKERIALQLRSAYLLVEPPDFCRWGTVVAQVKSVPHADETIALEDAEDDASQAAAIVKREPPEDETIALRDAEDGASQTAMTVERDSPKVTGTDPERTIDANALLALRNTLAECKAVVEPVCVFR